MLNPDKDFWRGKRVLLTGHTGFKGAWLAIWLQRLGADVTAVSLSPPSSPNLFSLAGTEKACRSVICDIRNASELASIIKKADPEIVFHLAAQALVRESYESPLDTFATNIMGTANLLDGLRCLKSLTAVVMVTTDKVYRNNEWVFPYREDDALGGHDPYSASKAASEIVIASYRDAFLTSRDVAIASARAGNVIGGGDWSQDRLIPDAVRAWQANETLEIRRPDAIRPWQHVLEPLSGYLILAEKLADKTAPSGAYNFGPETNECASVREVVELSRHYFTKGGVMFDDGLAGVHEASRLSLEIAKSANILGVRPRLNLTEAIERTMTWYKAQNEGADSLELCEAQISSYEAHNSGSTL